MKATSPARRVLQCRVSGSARQKSDREKEKKWQNRRNTMTIIMKTTSANSKTAYLCWTNCRNEILMGIFPLIWLFWKSNRIECVFPTASENCCRSHMFPLSRYQLWLSRCLAAIPYPIHQHHGILRLSTLYWLPPYLHRVCSIPRN